MILNYQNAFTESIADGTIKKGFPANLIRRAQMKLAVLNAASILRDCNLPPGNKLHALKGDRKGQHAIWINDQWRICFEWTKSGPANVEIVDYHD